MSDVNVEKIMEEIREEVEKSGPWPEIPSFEDAGKGIGYSADARGLRSHIEELTNDYVIPISFPDMGGNPLKKLYKKIVTKAVRCATAPMSTRITETNEALKTALEEAGDVIEKQQEQIDRLTKQVEALEKAAGEKKA